MTPSKIDYWRHIKCSSQIMVSRTYQILFGFVRRNYTCPFSYDEIAWCLQMQYLLVICYFLNEYVCLIVSPVSKKKSYLRSTAQWPCSESANLDALPPFPLPHPPIPPSPHPPTPVWKFARDNFDFIFLSWTIYFHPLLWNWKYACVSLAWILKKKFLKNQRSFSLEYSNNRKRNCVN